MFDRIEINNEPTEVKEKSASPAKCLLVNTFILTKYNCQVFS